MLREQGFEDTIHKNYPGIQIVDKRYGMADFAQSLTVSENMLTAHPDLDALFASNESSTVGAAQALKGRKGKVLLVGFDSSPTLLEDLKSGSDRFARRAGSISHGLRFGTGGGKEAHRRNPGRRCKTYLRYL